jgi:hypothetical protein
MMDICSRKIKLDLLLVVLMFGALPFVPSQQLFAEIPTTDNDYKKFFPVEVLSSETVEDISNSMQFLSLSEKVVKTMETVRFIDKPTLDDIVSINQEYLNNLQSTSGDTAVEAQKLE